MMENDRFLAGKNSAIVRFLDPAWSGSQEMSKSPQIRRANTSTRCGLVHITKKDRLSIRFFDPIFSIFAAVHSANVPITICY